MDIRSFTVALDVRKEMKTQSRLVQSIVSRAVKENRELSPEEKTKIENITKEFNKNKDLANKIEEMMRAELGERCADCGGPRDVEFLHNDDNKLICSDCYTKSFNGRKKV